MPEELMITGVVFTPAHQAHGRAGLLGYLRFQVGDGLEVDGVALRRTRAGRFALSFPRRRGRRFAVRPLHERTRLHVERQVLDALRAQGVLP